MDRLFDSCLAALAASYQNWASFERGIKELKGNAIENTSFFIIYSYRNIYIYEMQTNNT